VAKAEFTLTYDGPALRDHEMNVRDLAPAMLGVGEVFDALNTLYNGKAAEIAVNVRAHSPGCFTVVFDVVQVLRDATEFLSGTGITAALNLKEILFGVVGGGVSLVWLIRNLRGRVPDRIEKLSPGMLRLFVGDETYDVPIELLQAYQELSVRRALERFVSRPLLRNGIDEVRVESGGELVAHIDKGEAQLFRAPEPSGDVVVDDVRKAAYTIRDLSFEADGTWRLNDGTNPIKVKMEDPNFLAQVESDELRFAKHDVLLCLVHFVQRRTGKGLTTEYTVKEVLEHIPAPRQLRLPDAEEPAEAEFVEGVFEEGAQDGEAPREAWTKDEDDDEGGVLA
jgi:hypothetical protein